MQGTQWANLGRRSTATALRAVIAAAVVAGGMAASATAQDRASQGRLAQDKGTSNPIGGDFKTKTTASPGGSGITLDPKQVEAVKLVSAYFNDFQNLKGNFVQTDPEKKQRGKFWVKRPGRLRFEYNLPSKQLIISDGQQVSIQDLDLKTDDRISLDQTPFRILLKKDVDLMRDARIFDVQESADLIILVLQDKSPDAPGRIKLIMSRAPAIELKEWVTTDQQGKDTRVEVSTIVKTEDIDVNLFKITSPTLDKKPGQ